MASKIDFSVVVTVLNEEQSITSLLDSLAQQTLLPSEIIIVDAGSTDATVTMIKRWKTQNTSLHLTLMEKPGSNRSQGRNIGINTASNLHIAVTDAGCIADKEWLKNLEPGFANPQVQIVAGFYHCRILNNWQRVFSWYLAIQPKHFNTAFTVSIIRGVLISLLIFLLIPIIVSFYQEPSVAYLLVLISLVPLLRGFINPAVVTFQQQLKFKQEFFYKSSILIGDGAVAIALALYLKSAASLVYGTIAGVVIELIISHLFIRPHPQWSFNQDQFQRMLHRGKWITGAGIFSYLASRIPDISLGKLVSTNALGLYQMAYRFSVIPIEELIEIFNRVAFPVYSLIREDRDRLTRAIRKNVAIFWTISLIICSMIYLLSPRVIPLILGPTWISIIPYIQLFAFTGSLIALSTPVNPIYLATKNQQYLTLTTLIQMGAAIIIIVPLTRLQGIGGTIWAFNFSLILTLPFRWFFAYKSITKV